jgi:hypothetical protein
MSGGAEVGGCGDNGIEVPDHSSTRAAEIKQERRSLGLHSGGTKLQQLQRLLDVEPNLPTPVAKAAILVRAVRMAAITNKRGAQADRTF